MTRRRWTSCCRWSCRTPTTAGTARSWSSSASARNIRSRRRCLSIRRPRSAAITSSARALARQVRPGRRRVIALRSQGEQPQLAPEARFPLLVVEERKRGPCGAGRAGVPGHRRCAALGRRLRGLGRERLTVRMERRLHRGGRMVRGFLPQPPCVVPGLSRKVSNGAGDRIRITSRYALRAGEIEGRKR